jgi:hypothetical protein
MGIPADSGYFLPIHTGLLRDEKWEALSARLRGTWVTLFLLLDGEHEVGWFASKERIVWLLTREGWTTAQARGDVASLVEMGWLHGDLDHPDDNPAITLRGWLYHTGKEARKGAHNRARPSDRERRGDGPSPVETRGDLDETRRDETKTPRKRARGDGSSPQTTAEILGGPSFKERVGWKPPEA